MVVTKVLSIDESGKASYRHTSLEFALIGVVIEEKFKSKLENKLKKIKKKFFQDEEIILHFSEIARKIGPFNVLKDTTLEINFWCEMLALLNDDKIHYFFTLVDKAKAQKIGWLDITIIQRSYSQLIKMYVCDLSSNDKGKIITESDTFQDVYLTKAHNSFKNNGIKECGLSGREYMAKITSLSFVNKNNQDPEVQIADLLGSTIRLKYRLENKASKEKYNKVEKNKLKLLNRKIKKDKSNFTILI